MDFTFANESHYDAVIKASVNGKNVYERRLSSNIVSGTYSGPDLDFLTVETPSHAFTLTLEEDLTQIKKKLTVDPREGKFIDTTFWGDEFTVTQGTQQPLVLY